MTVTDADIAELATLLNKGRDNWIHGRLQWEDPDSPMAQADDTTIFGPFGGMHRRERHQLCGRTFNAKLRHGSRAAPVQLSWFAPSLKAISQSSSTSTGVPCDSTAATTRGPGCFGLPRCFASRSARNGSDFIATQIRWCASATWIRLGRLWSDHPPQVPSFNVGRLVGTALGGERFDRRDERARFGHGFNLYRNRVGTHGERLVVEQPLDRLADRFGVDHVRLE